MYFPYGEEETEYLKSRDPALGAVIDAAGHICREMDEDLFSAVVHHIIAQQISSAAQATVWNRLREKCGTVCAESGYSMNTEELQACGMTFRKAGYIHDFADKVYSGEFSLDALSDMEYINRIPLAFLI